MFLSKIVAIRQRYLGETDAIHNLQKYKPFWQLILGYIVRIADLEREKFMEIEGVVVMLQAFIHAKANRHFSAWVAGSVGATALAIGTLGIATPIAVGTISKTHKEKKKNRIVIKKGWMKLINRLFEQLNNSRITSKIRETVL